MTIQSASSINNAIHSFKPGKICRTLSGIGRMIPDKVSDFCDLTTNASMKRTTQFAILAACVVLSRYIQARNDDEKREILTRDTGMLFTAVYGVPLFKKVASIFINKRTGIPIAHGEKGILKNINPEKGIQMASYEQLSEWLSVNSTKSFDGIKNGFTGFCVNIKKLGGNLIKCLNILDKNSKETIKNIAKSVGINEEVTNKNILKVIYKAEKSTDKGVQDNLNKLKELFVQDKNGMNPLLQKASNLKSATGFTCIAATAFVLGGLLPWFNIHHTKKLYEQNKAKNNEQPKILPANNSNIINKFELFKKTGQLV